jgi:hydroxymethylpyrimidine pyrophosphatase-like HAD family hydrolase
VARCRLLALDLDGTLLRQTGTIAPADRRAVAQARALGITVVLATGRLPHLTLPHARALGIAGPSICADGSLTVRAADGSTVESAPLPAAATARLVAVAEALGLCPVLLTAEALVGLDAAGATWLGGWSRCFQAVGDLPAWLAERTRLPVLIAFALGLPGAVRAAAATLAGQPGVAVDHFGLGAGAPFTVRLQAAGADKGRALARLARRLGLERSAVAAIGDWHNDVSMLRWARHSFAMGHAPLEVARAARRRLRATARAGGGVAEAWASLRAASDMATGRVFQPEPAASPGKPVSDDGEEDPSRWLPDAG